MALAAELLGERWTLLILREAFYGVFRFEDIQADLDVPRSVLTERLNRLVERGILARKSYREEGRRARQGYVLTKIGSDLAPVLIALTEWGERHLLGHDAPVQVVHRESGRRLRLQLVELDGQGEGSPVALRDARLALRKS